MTNSLTNFIAFNEPQTVYYRVICADGNYKSVKSFLSKVENKYGNDSLYVHFIDIDGLLNDFDNKLDRNIDI